MTTTTRLSLYKLFRPSTIWVNLTVSEYRQILHWLELHKSRTSRRNAADNLHDTFLWFPTIVEEGVWVPAGHMSRLFDQIEARTPTNAAVHPSLALRQSLQRIRDTLTGAHIFDLRIAATGRAVGQ